MNMKIAVISTGVGTSPEELTHSFVFEEVVKLAERGVKVHVIRFKQGMDVKRYGVYYHNMSRNVIVYFLEGLPLLKVYSQRPSLFMRKFTKIIFEVTYFGHVLQTIKRKINESKIDLIHAHFAYPEGFIGACVKNKIRKPLIVTLHGYDILIDPTIDYGIRLNPKYDYIVRNTLRVADAVIVASRAVYREVLKLNLKRNKVFLIPNGVDVNRFNPNLDNEIIRRKLGLEGKFIVFTLRNHVPKNGIEYLIRAIPYVVKRARKNVHFIIGGDGPLRKFHELLVKKLGVEQYVTFTGVIPWEDLPYYYAASDVVVVPSIQEAFGLVVSEAMACGKPVIGTNVGGIPDQIIDGYNGFLVEPRSPAQIAERILYFVDSQKEVQRMGRNGRKLVEEKFNIEKRVEKIMELYKEMINNS